MDEPEIIKIGIIGNGKMGTDIFYYLADFNFHLTWVCRSEEGRKNSTDPFVRKLSRRRRSGLVDGAFVSYRMMNTNITTRLSELSDSDIVIEAIGEDTDAKAKLFGELDPLVRKDTVIASNSSSIKPSCFIKNVGRPEYYAGLHFFFPVKYKNIVEITTTDSTGERAINRIKKFLSIIERFYIILHESEGFILNRIFLDFQAQAYRYYAEGALEPEEIDVIVKKDIFPLGVFEFMDSVGIDVMYRSVINYTRDLSDREFYNPLLQGLQRLVREKRLGRKSGAGFYDYQDNASHKESNYRDDLRTSVSSCLICLYINSAFKALEKNICSREDMEYAIREYMGTEKGPFTLADEIGAGKILKELTGLYEKTGFDAFKPSCMLKPV